MNKDLLNYLKWADNAIITVISDLAAEQLNQSLYGQQASIHHKTKHLAEEYYAWLMDLKEEDWSKEIQDLEELDTQGLISKIHEYHHLWDQYLASDPPEQYQIDEGVRVTITLDEVIFNLVNHSSYHRGQIVFLLRTFGYQPPVTDYYWYLMDLQKNAK